MKFSNEDNSIGKYIVILIAAVLLAGQNIVSNLVYLGHVSLTLYLGICILCAVYAIGMIIRIRKQRKISKFYKSDNDFLRRQQDIKDMQADLKRSE